MTYVIKLMSFIGGLLSFMAGSLIMKLPFYPSDSQSLVIMVKIIGLGLMLLGIILFLKVFKTKEG